MIVASSCGGDNVIAPDSLRRIGRDHHDHHGGKAEQEVFPFCFALQVKDVLFSELQDQRDRKRQKHLANENGVSCRRRQMVSVSLGGEVILHIIARADDRGYREGERKIACDVAEKSALCENRHWQNNAVGVVSPAKHEAENIGRVEILVLKPSAVDLVNKCIG